MKMVKALLLGAAAGLAGVAGAQAADLPGKAAPASYVKICDTYGAGYYYIPGSNTCLKIGGYVRQHIYTGQSYNAGTQNNIDFRSRFLLSLDARSQTEYGLLRASGSFFVQRGAGNAGFVGGAAEMTGTAPDQTLAALASAFVQFGRSPLVMLLRSSTSTRTTSTSLTTAAQPSVRTTPRPTSLPSPPLSAAASWPLCRLKTRTSVRSARSAPTAT